MNSDETVKEELYDEERNICCPILGNKSKQLKRLLKDAFHVVSECATSPECPMTTGCQ